MVEAQPFDLRTEHPMQCHSYRIIGWLELKCHLVQPLCNEHGCPMHLWRNSRFSWVSKWKSKENTPRHYYYRARRFLLYIMSWDIPQLLCTPEGVQVRGESCCLPPSGMGPVLSALTVILLVPMYKLPCLGNILRMDILLPHVAENGRNIRNFSLAQG